MTLNSTFGTSDEFPKYYPSLSEHSTVNNEHSPAVLGPLLIKAIHRTAVPYLRMHYDIATLTNHQLFVLVWEENPDASKYIIDEVVALIRSNHPLRVASKRPIMRQISHH